MNLFEKIAQATHACLDSRIKELVLGWYASFAVSEDQRWGIGYVPNSLKEPHKSRESHTHFLTCSTLIGLADLFPSPFPQEFAAASAACAALLPFPKEGLPLDNIMPCARGDKVAVLGYEKELLPLMRDWGWKIAVFDDFGQGPDCFPQKNFSEGVDGADWVWLTPESIRDRWFISITEKLRQKKGCFLQGPGIPYLKGVYSQFGITHLITPRITGDSDAIRFRLGAGGDLWLSREIEWAAYFSE